MAIFAHNIPPTAFSMAGWRRLNRHGVPIIIVARGEESLMSNTTEHALSKVPEVTLIFWVIKIAATTLGETGGDAVSMSMNLGYLVGTAIFAVIFLVAVAAQIKAKCFHPHAPPWRRGRRFSRQTSQRRRIGIKPLFRIGSSARLHPDFHPDFPTKAGKTTPLIRRVIFQERGYYCEACFVNISSALRGDRIIRRLRAGGSLP